MITDSDESGQLRAILSGVVLGAILTLGITILTGEDSLPLLLGILVLSIVSIEYHLKRSQISPPSIQFNLEHTIQLILRSASRLNKLSAGKIRELTLAAIRWTALATSFIYFIIRMLYSEKGDFFVHNVDNVNMTDPISVLLLLLDLLADSYVIVLIWVVGMTLWVVEAEASTSGEL